MTINEINRLEYGLYRIYWKDGKSTIAFVGPFNECGRPMKVWIAEVDYLNTGNIGFKYSYCGQKHKLMEKVEIIDLEKKEVQNQESDNRILSEDLKGRIKVDGLPFEIGDSFWTICKATFKPKQMFVDKINIRLNSMDTCFVVIISRSEEYDLNNCYKSKKDLIDSFN